MKYKLLERDFYLQPVVDVARSLIGKRLVRNLHDDLLAGIIIETEAYDGEQDRACHAHRGKTRRNAVMYGPPGCAYVYFTYGLHWLLNCVTGAEDYPAAVLIRAIQPIHGLEVISQNRAGIAQELWCNGPAKLTRALAIDGTFNGCDLCQQNGMLQITEGITIPDNKIQATPRIGIGYAGEPWISKPWRFEAKMQLAEVNALIE